MKKFLDDGLKTESISSYSATFIAEFAIGICFSFAACLGVMSSQQYAASTVPIPLAIIRGLFIGITFWTVLAGFSIRAENLRGIFPIRIHTALGWVLFSFVICTIIPLISVFPRFGGYGFNGLQIFRTSLISVLSFGLAGVIISLTAILLHYFFWRLLAGLKWGITLTCAMGFFLGLCAGWAAYGWVVFSSQVLFSLHITSYIG